MRQKPHPAINAPQAKYDFGIGYVYAAQLTNGTVKIGFTRSPRNRIKTLSGMTRRMFGSDVARFAYGPGVNVCAALQAEGRALSAFRQEFAPVGRRLGEFFVCADFGKACGLIGASALPEHEAKAA